MRMFRAANRVVSRPRSAFLPQAKFGFQPTFTHFARFSTEGGSSADVPAVGDMAKAEDTAVWTSTATRDTAYSQHKNLKGSPRKVNDLCRMIRGLSADEALIQLQFSPNQKALFVANVLKSACTNGVNNFHMDRKRLYVKKAVATKGQYRKKLKPGSRGRAFIINNYYCHIKIHVAEQEYKPEEKRIGRFPSRSYKSLKKSEDAIAAYKNRIMSKAN